MTSTRKRISLSTYNQRFTIEKRRQHFMKDFIQKFIPRKKTHQCRWHSRRSSTSVYVVTVFLEKKMNMLKKITKRKLFLREFVRKSQWQGIYVGFEVRIVLTISSLSFSFFFSIICQQLIVVLSISGPSMRRWMNSEPLRIRSC